MGERDHYLHGAEDVRSAASSMRSAADTMSSAASSMQDAANRIRDTNFEQQRFLTEWLDRLEAIVEKIPCAK